MKKFLSEKAGKISHNDNRNRFHGKFNSQRKILWLFLLKNSQKRQKNLMGQNKIPAKSWKSSVVIVQKAFFSFT